MEKMSTETSISTRSKIAPKLDLMPPPKFQVIFLNDDVTTVEFVMHVLTSIFDHNADHAAVLTERIHHDGQAAVAIFPFEIAESKAVETTILARTNSFPLNVKIEPVP